MKNEVCKFNFATKIQLKLAISNAVQLLYTIVIHKDLSNYGKSNFSKTMYFLFKMALLMPAQMHPNLRSFYYCNPSFLSQFSGHLQDGGQKHSFISNCSGEMFRGRSRANHVRLGRLSRAYTSMRWYGSGKTCRNVCERVIERWCRV